MGAVIRRPDAARQRAVLGSSNQGPNRHKVSFLCPSPTLYMKQTGLRPSPVGRTNLHSLEIRGSRSQGQQEAVHEWDGQKGWL